MYQLAVRILLLVSAAALLGGGCNETHGLFRFEDEFLEEDVVDLMTLVFQSSENGFLGDPVDEDDVIEEASAANDFTVTYDLPEAGRLGLGFGTGRVDLRIFEDGVAVEDPLDFTYAGSSAARITVHYDIRYEGETRDERLTDQDFLITIDVFPQPGGGFVVEYFVEGEAFLGATLCDRLLIQFRADGEPRTGLDPEFGDGEGRIDDPDVFAIFFMDLDWFNSVFRAEGDVGRSSFFREEFAYSEVF